MKIIKLTQGKVAIVDDEDFEKLNQYKWFAHFSGWNWYAGRKASKIDGKGMEIKMHREIINTPKGVPVDHRNGDGLDNQKENLRLATNQENGFNRKSAQKNNKLGIKGVCWHRDAKKFQARIRINGKQIYLGLFESLDEADIAYRRAELKYFGEFVRESSRLYVKISSPEYQRSLAG